MKRQAVFAVIMTAAWVAIGFLAIEAYVRFVEDDGMQFDLEMWKYAREVKQVSKHPMIGHEHAPNRQATLMGVDFKTNSNRLRDRDIPYQRTENKLRILMLGDSLTVGWGVPLQETSSKRIEKLYANDRIDAEVINAGVGNYNTIQEVEYFLTEGYRYHPDIVVLNFFVNDAEPLQATEQPSFIKRNCYSCIFVAGRLDTVLRKFFTKADWTDYYLSLYGDGRAKGWLDAKAALGKLADYCRTNNIQLLVVSLPELHDVQNYRFQRITDLVHQAADDLGVPFADILTYLKTQESSKLWVTPPDPHPNGFANEFIAKGIYQALQGMKFKHEAN
jgi:lysophospholipase L1-like esterase